jgi:hypothetical protein
LHDTGIHVIRPVPVALAMIIKGIDAPVEVSRHRQNMGEHDTDIGPDST